MKWKVSWLKNQIDQQHQVEEVLVFNREMFNSVSNISYVDEVAVNGEIYLDDDGLVNVSLSFTGVMMLPCVITNEVGPYDFAFSIDEILDDSYTNAVDYKADYIDLLEITWQQLIVEAPTRFVKKDIDNKSGKSWKLLTEDEYNETTENIIDPRLAKLQNLFNDDKEE